MKWLSVQNNDGEGGGKQITHYLSCNKNIIFEGKQHFSLLSHDKLGVQTERTLVETA